MTPASTLRDLLAVEDDPRFLGFKCDETGLLLWPLIRLPFLRLILSDLLYDAAVSGPLFQKADRLLGLKTAAAAAFHNLRRHGDAERRCEVHRLRRSGFRDHLSRDDRKDRRG